MKDKWEKFKHRTLTKVFLGYSVVAWVLIQVIEAVLPTFETPLWVAQTIAFLLILGFPIAILVGWASEKLPTLTDSVANASAVPEQGHTTPKRTLIWIGMVSCSIVGLFGFYMMPFIFDETAFSTREGIVVDIEVDSSPGYRGTRSSLLIGESGFRTGINTRTDLAISPDGNSRAYLMHEGNRSNVMVRDLQSFDDARNLGVISGPGGSGNIKFSPGGEWIVFQNLGELTRVRIEGGAFQSIAGTEIQRPWGSHAIIDQDIYFISGQGFQVYKVAFSGESEEAEMVSNPDQGFFGLPSTIPGTKNLLVTVCETLNGWSDCDIGVMDVLTGEVKTIIQTAFDASYASSGHIVFLRDATLWAVPFDLDTLQTIGGQVPVIQGLEGNSFYTGNFAYSFSDNGRLVYLQGDDAFQGGARVDIAWVDKDGQRESLSLPEGTYGNINLSPDQTQLALTSYNGSSSDVWIWDIEQEIFSRLTFEDDAAYPIWTTDGAGVIYQRTQPPFGLWVTSSDGTGQPTILTDSQEILYPETVAPDGSIIFSVGDNTDRKLYSLNTSGERIQTLIDIGPNQVRSSRISPDGQWLLYTSNESGEFEAFIRPWPNYDEGKWQASRLGGGQPLWDQENNNLYFWAPSGIQYFVNYEIQTDTRSGRPSFRFQQPQELFSFPEPRSLQTFPGWDYFRAEDRFLMIAQGGVEQNQTEQVLAELTILSVVENWVTELQGIAPPDPR